MAALATAFVEVRPQTDKFGPDLKRKLAQVDASSSGKKVGESFGRGLGGSLRLVSRVGGRSLGLLATGASAAGLALGGAAVAGATFGLKTAASMEQARISFTTMLGGAKQADVFLRKLQKFAATTPFEFPELQTAASSLISAGINADKVIPIMTTLGDVTSGMGTGSEGIRRATIALQQMSAAGKITGEDLNQLRDAGVPVFDLLAAATGKSKAQVVALAQAGKLGGKELGQLMKALETGKGLERFSGLMEKQSHSLSGLFSTLKDNVSMSLSNLITPAIPAIKAGLEWIGNATAVAGPKIQAGFALLAVGIKALIGAFKEGDITSGGFVGGMERIGLAARITFDFFQTSVLPRIKAFGGFLRDDAVPALAAFGGWLVKNRAWLVPIAAGIGAIIAAVKVWTGVSKAFAVAQGVVNVVLAANPIGIVVLAIVGLVAAFVVAYKTSDTFRAIVQRAWAGIQVAASFAWNNVLRPTFAAMNAFVRNVLAPTVSWLWRNVVVPAFNGIKGIISVVWPIIRGLFQTWVAFVRNVLAPIITWLWRNVVVPAFNSIRDKIGAVWKVVRPILAALGSFIRDRVAPAFSAGVTAIGRAWDRVRAIAAIPINFIIDTVLNKGIFKAYNWIVSKFGGTKIPRLPLIGQGDTAPRSRSRNGSAAGLARGGTVPFVTNGPRAIVGEGNPRYPEYVIPTDPQHRRRALSLYQDLGAQMLDAGGVIGAGFRAGLKRAASVVTANADNDPTKWLSQKISAALGVVGQSPFARTLMGIPRRIGQILLTQAKGLLTGAGGGTFAAGLKGVVNFARSQVGDPYVWGGVGPNGYDCSGFVSNLVEVAKGLPLYRRLFATGSMGSYPWPNHYNGAFRVGWTANAGGGIGHTAATVNGVNMESRGGDGVVVGARSRGANQSIFDRHAFLARGGILRSWVTGGDGSRAKMLRAHINRGGTFFEDFSYRGMSPFYRRGNDRLASHFWAGHPGFDFGGPGSRRAIGGWLNRVISDAIRGIQQRGLARGGLIPGMPGDPPFDVLDRRGKYYQPGLLDAVREAKVADRGAWLAPNSTTMVQNGTSEWEPVGPPGGNAEILAALDRLESAVVRASASTGREVGITLAKFGGGRR